MVWKAMFFMVVLLVLFSGCSLLDDVLSSARTAQEKAVDAGDASICDRASHPDTCRIAVAKSEGNSSICDDIDDETKQMNCYAQAR